MGLHLHCRAELISQPSALKVNFPSPKMGISCFEGNEYYSVLFLEGKIHHSGKLSLLSSSGTPGRLRSRPMCLSAVVGGPPATRTEDVGLAAFRAPRFAGRGCFCSSTVFLYEVELR